MTTAEHDFLEHLPPVGHAFLVISATTADCPSLIFDMTVDLLKFLDISKIAELLQVSLHVVFLGTPHTTVNVPMLQEKGSKLHKTWSSTRRNVI